MSFKNKNYIKKINLKYDEGEEVPEFISYERQAAIHDLINENSFSTKEADNLGPYNIEIEIIDNILILQISNDDKTIAWYLKC